MNNSDEEHKDELFKSLNSQNHHDDVTSGGKSSSASSNNGRGKVYLGDSDRKDTFNSNNSSSPSNTSSI